MHRLDLIQELHGGNGGATPTLPSTSEMRCNHTVINLQDGDTYNIPFPYMTYNFLSSVSLRDDVEDFSKFFPYCTSFSSSVPIGINKRP